MTIWNNTFMAGVFALSVAAGLLSPTSSEAQGQQSCGPTSIVTSTLTEKYGEHEVFIGLSGGGLISIYLNPESGSWTALRHLPTGTTCLLSGGTAGSVFIPVEGEEM